ncbi:Uncharacterised protein [uncultured archaeon]|nr:Uncharacterised protein [uncultured archaeon]
MAVFAAVALAVPALMLVFSKLVRPESDGNEVVTKSYESAEESDGQRASVMDEYMHFFTIFLAFEVIGAVIIVWGLLAKQLDFTSNVRIEALLVAGLVLSMFALALGRRSD